MKILKLLRIIIVAVLLVSCVQDAHLKTITVKIDMNAIENPNKVGIRGTHPLSWDETTYLNDTNSNGIYEDTFQIYATGNTVEFKFVNNETEFELRDKSNRILNFQFQPETITYEAIFDNLNAVTIKRE